MERREHHRAPARGSRRFRLAPAAWLVFFLQAAAATAAPWSGDQFVHQQWTVEDGLPVNALTDIVQTPDGYLWIASFDGLLRFDGVRFARFDTVAVPALRSNRVVKLLTAADGSLWIVSEQGHLTRHAGGRFHAVDVAQGDSPFVVAMAQDGAGVLWLATRSGLYRAQDDRLVASPEELEGVPIFIVGEGARGRVWLATADRRLAVLDSGTPRWSEHRLEANAFCLVEDAEGSLWIGTWGALLRRRHERTESVPALEAARQAVAAGRLVSPLRSRPLDLSWEDESGRGVLLRGPRGAVWELRCGSLLRDGREVLRLPDQCFVVMTFDHEGTVWLTTQTQGLHALRPARVKVLGEAEGLANKNAFALHQDQRGVIWISDRLDGLTRVDGETVTTIGSEAFGPTALYDDPGSGLLLMGGFWALADPADTMTRQIPLRNVSSPEMNVHAFAYHRAPDGRLLVGGHDGLWESRRGDPQDDGWRFRRVEGTAGWIVRVILEDGEGTVWLGTNGHGVARLRDGHLTRVSTAEGLSSDLVRDLHLDAGGVLWIATEDRGLNRLDPASSEPPVVIQQRHGLWDDALHRILEDDAGWLWISTNRGIFRVRRSELDDFAAGRLARVDSVAYTEKDGMRSREANGGVQGAGLRARDGKLWFPTQDGVAILDPEELTRDLPPPPVHVERLRTGERELAATGELTLALGERSFRVEYTALSFRAPERMRFAYRLEGFDDDWQDAGAERTATYTRVPPGRYRFRVKARSSEGVWNEAEPLALEVVPYFYETRWFKALCGLAAVALLLAGARLRERRLRQRQRHLEILVTQRTRDLEREKETVARQAEKLTELDRAKSELFANISHEFRTPLTLILSPLRDFQDNRYGPLPQEALREVGRMRGNAARLLELVGQLLDAARLEAGGLELQVVREDLGAFLRLIAERFVAVAERRRLDFSVDAGDEPVWLWFDPEQLDKALSNLLSNAFKFTRRGGRVELTVSPAVRPPRSPQGDAADDWVRVAVRDTGRGIAPRELPRLFDRFFQVESALHRRHPGTGLGLALARDLVDLHGGTLEVESTRGEGSTFTVSLRRGRGHFRAEQIVESDQGDGSVSLDTATTTGLSIADRAIAVEAVLAEIDGAPSEDEARPDARTWPEDDRTTVLVVDDHPDLRAHVRRHLEDRYRVVEAGDGAAGLTRARELLPDLVISDVMMPEMDGFAFCRAMKQDPELDFIPVILLTAKAAAEDKLDGLHEGADDYLTKPFDVRELVARVDNLIAQRRRLRERFSVPPPPSLPLAAGVTPSEDDRDFLTRVRDTIDDGIDDEDFKVDALARRLYVDRTRLFRRLRELTASTPSALILEARLTRAAKLLEAGQGGVGEVAVAVGFKSVAHFSQRFRSRFGSTPSSYVHRE